MATIAELLAQQQMQGQGFNEYQAPLQTFANNSSYSPHAGVATNALTGLAQGLAQGIFGGFYQKRQAELQRDNVMQLQNIATMQQGQELETFRQKQQIQQEQQLASDRQRQEMDLTTFQSKASFEASMRAPELQTVDLGTEKRLYETSFDPATKAFQRQLLSQNQKPQAGPRITRESREQEALQRLMGDVPQQGPQAPAPAALSPQGQQEQQALAPAAQSQQSPQGQQPVQLQQIDPILLKARQYAQQGLKVGEAREQAKADFEKYQTFSVSADQLEGLATRLEVAARKAGQTGPGYINEVRRGINTTLAPAFGRAADSQQGQEDLKVIGSEFGKFQTGEIASKLIDTDTGFRALLAPLLPGVDKTQETNLTFVKQMRVTANLARQKAARLGFDLSFAGEGQQQAQQPQQQRDPQQQAVANLGLPESGGNPPAAGGSAAPLAARVMMAESGGNPAARSTAGAQGLMQVMPKTAEQQLQKLGLQGQDPNDPQVNARIGGDYLAEEVKRYGGDEKLALAAYNWGRGNIDNALKKTGGSTWNDISDLAPKETRDYVNKITSPNFAVRVAQRINENPYFNYVAGLASQAFDGGTVGLGEEMQAKINAFATGNKYDDALGQVRADDKTFRDTNPKSSFAANVAGSLIAPGAAVAKGVRSAAGLGKLGAAQGAAYGFGSEEGGVGNRVYGAVKGGMFGYGTGLAAGGVATGVKALAGTNLANTLYSKLAPQRGSISNKSVDVLEKEASGLADTMFKMTRKLGVTSEDLATATATATAAQKRGVPLSVFDAASVDMLPGESMAGITTNSKLAQRINTLSNNSGGAKLGKSLIDARGADASDRVVATLDKLAPGKQLHEGAREFLDAVKGKISTEEKARAAIAAPLYEAALEKTPLIDPEISKGILEMDLVKAQIKHVRKIDHSLKSLPDNSSRVFHSVEKVLGDKVADLVAKKKKNEARLYEQARRKIAEAMPQGIRDADDAFAKSSGVLNALSDGQFKAMREISRGNTLGALNRLKNLQPEEILEFKKALGPEYHDQLKAGIKSALLDKLAAQKDGTNKELVSHIVGSKKQRESLKALVGDDDYNEIILNLRDEQRLFLANRNYFKGSSSANNLTDLIESQNSLEKTVGIGEKIAQEVKGGVAGVAGSLIKAIAKSTRAAPDPTLEERLTRALLDPQSSIDIAKRLAPMLAAAEARARKVAAATGKSSRLTTIIASRQ